MKIDGQIGDVQPRMILSTTLIQADSDVRVRYLTEAPDVTGIPHYVGHPATRALLDAAGAVYTPGKAPPIAAGEAFLFCRLDDSRKGEAFTTDRADTTGLVWGVVYRFPTPVINVASEHTLALAGSERLSPDFLPAGMVVGLDPADPRVQIVRTDASIPPEHQLWLLLAIAQKVREAGGVLKGMTATGVVDEINLSNVMSFVRR